jgi:xanthine dehydrogenase YagS FAD-binding subunit
MDIQGELIRAARVAVGGVGTVPWRLPEVERALVGRTASDQVWTDAAARAADGATPLSGNAFKVELVKRTVARQLATIGARV